MNLIFRNFWNTLRRYKVASVLNIAGLGVAFAAFAVIMMQVRYDLTYDRFHSNADRIFRLEIPMQEGREPGITVPRPLARELVTSASSDIVQGGLMRTRGSTNFSADNQSFVRERLWIFTPEILQIFDFQIVAGDTARLREPNTRLISQSTAERLYGDADPIDRQIFAEEDSLPSQVVAVYKDFPDNSMLPNGVFMDMRRENYNSRGNWNYEAFLLLATADKTRAEADIRAYIPGRSADSVLLAASRLSPLTGLHFQPGTDMLIEKANQSTVYTLLSIAFLIVLIAAINFVNFSTSMVPMRLRSINTQRVLGASTGSIRVAIIGEAIGMALIGLGLAYWLVYALSGTSFSGGSLLNLDMSFAKHGAVLRLTAAVAVITGLLAGLYPAFYITSFQPALVIKGSFGLSPAGKRLRTGLISVQYVISLVLIITALFMQTQNDYMKGFPIGYDRENLLLFNVSNKLSQNPQALREELLRDPSIRGVEFAAGSPISTSGMGMGWGRAKPDGEEIMFDVLPVSPGFPELLGLETIEGRLFRQSDDLSQNGVYLFNEKAGKKFGLSLDMRMEGHLGKEHPAEIAGFVRDFHFKPLHYDIEPVALYVWGVDPWTTFQTAFTRVDGANVAATIDFIRQTVSRMDPEQVDVDVEFLDASIGGLYAKEDRLANLITLFSALAVLISIIGVFGLVLFETQYRRKEIGVRRVHGATIGEILRLLNRNFVRIVIVCFVIAAPVAYYAVKRWLEGFAYQSPVHWWIFAVALLAVGAITVLTVTLQSYRAATENPVNSIKTE